MLRPLVSLSVLEGVMQGKKSMRDPELWERLKAKSFDDAARAVVAERQGDDGDAAKRLIEAFRRYLYLGAVTDGQNALPTSLAPILNAYRAQISDHDTPAQTAPDDASLAELRALYQLEFGEQPPVDIWGEKASTSQQSGTRPVAWIISGGLALSGLVLGALGQWWFFLPILAALTVLVGWGKTPLYKRGFVYDWPTNGSTGA